MTLVFRAEINPAVGKSSSVIQGYLIVLRQTHQRGHDPATFRSQGSIQSGWKL